jgi:pyrroline-5-carboxylate reductase
MKIAIVGVGRLGSVFARALSKGHELILIDRDFRHAVEVASPIGAQAVKDLAAAKTADMAIIAVKPQHVEDVVGQIKDAPLIVSCAAGIPLNKFESWGARNTIRIMPNICAEVGEAVIAYAIHPEVEKKERLFLAVFSSLGMCIKADEDHLDAITATSGSGPAFVAFFAEAMIGEAVGNGLDRETTEMVVAQTFLGTGKLMKAGWSTKKIIEAAASPGSSAAESLKALEKKGADKAIRGAMGLAAVRTRKPGK